MNHTVASHHKQRTHKSAKETTDILIRRFFCVCVCVCVCNLSQCSSCSKKREVVPDLAPLLWHTFGTTAALLQEIVNIYPAINPATLTAHQSNRVCNALALLQCVASHPETRSVFLQAHVPLFLYPFLHTVSKTRPFEYLRLTSLGVIGALVKASGGQSLS